MNNKTTLQKLNIGLLYLMQIFVVGLVFATENLYVISFLSVVQLILCIEIIYKKTEKYVSFPIIFILISYIFHMGRIVYIHLFLHDDVKLGFWVNTHEIIVQACKFNTISMFFFAIGCSSYGVLRVKIGEIKRGKYFSDDTIFKMGLIFFIVGIIPKFSVDIEKLMVGLTYGYLSTYDVDVSGRATLGTLVYTGILLILLSKRKNIILCRILLVIVCMYEMLIMLSGNRYMSISFIITLLFVYCKYIETPRLKKVILYLVLGIFVLTVLNTIREVRLEKISLNLLISTFHEQLIDNPIKNIMLELGGTMNTMVLSIYNFPANSKFGFGKTYLYFIPNLIPKVKWGFDYECLTYTAKFSIAQRSAIGGSYLGEFYYNFGSLGVVASVIIGMLDSFIEKKMRLEKKISKGIVLCLPIILYSFSYIRGYFAAYRIAVYHIIVLGIGMALLNSMRKNKC